MSIVSAAHALARLIASPLVARVRVLLADEPEEVYVVGGSVRDALLGRSIGDLDLAVVGAALPLARRLADRLHAAYVPMDPEHDVARIVLGPSFGGAHIDLAGLRGPDIQADLGARDFTCNALAFPLTPELGPLLDPTNGLADLEAGLLRTAYARAFVDDPLRVLRAVRLAAQFDLRWDADTARWARASTPDLRQVSGERIRDEVLRMMGLAAVAHAWELGAALDVWPVILPEVSTPAASQAACQRLADLERALPAEASGGWHGLEAFRARVLEEWAGELSMGRTRGQLMRLAATLAPLRAEAVAAVAARLRLSRQEGQHLVGAVRASQCAGGVREEAPLDPLAAYRYFRAYGPAGVDGALLAAAWDEGCLSHAGALLDAWWRRHAELVEPPALVTGAEVMQALALAPGPRVGAALEAVRQAQVQGLVHDAAQALAYLRERCGE